MALFEIKSKFKDLRNTVMQLTPIEIKVRECTSNDSWGAKTSDKQEIAEATYNYEDFKLIMGQLWKRMADTGKNWRHVYKGLQLLEYLIAHGSERVIDDAKDQIYTIRTLKNFQYVDEKGKDHGQLVREASKKMVAFLQDEKAIQEERQKGKAMKDKFEGFSRTESRYKASQVRTSSKAKASHSATKASYDEDYEDEDRPRRPQRRSYESDEEERHESRATKNQSYDDEEDEQPQPRRKMSNIKVKGHEEPRSTKPRPPSFEQERPAPKKEQKAKDSDLMDMFFPTDTVNAPVTTSAPVSRNADPFADPFASNDGFNTGSSSGFNPRGGFDQGFNGQATQQQQGGFDADFEADFDDSFGSQKPQAQQNNELFDFTQGLVDLSLSEKEQKRREEIAKQQQNQGTKMTIGELKKLKAQQGGLQQPPARTFSPSNMSTNQNQRQFQGYPPQQGGFQQQGFPPQQQGFQQGGQFQGYPPQQQQGGFQGYPPQQGFQQGGFPQQQQQQQRQQQQGFGNDFF